MKKHRKKLRVALYVIAFMALILQLSFLFKDNNFAVLNPKGFIAAEQKELFIFTVLLSLVVVIPVFVMLFLFAHRYNEKNQKAKYSPNLDGNKTLETIWWGVPILLIFILSIVTFQSSHKLNPFKPIDAEAKTLKIQVLALQWKWLFIYPEENIATVNYLKIPVDRPIEFAITSDAPMNSFWIPQLGGQIYAMSGMSTEINLIANTVGEFRGSSANLSGRGFAGMNFPVHATSEADFDSWVVELSDNADHADLDSNEYKKLTSPTQNDKPKFYHLHDNNLYHDSVMKYIEPSENKHSEANEGLKIIDSYEGHR